MSGEIATIIVSALVAAVAGPIGSWIGRKVERTKYEVEVGQLRAEMKDKLAEVKGRELENVRQASDILMQSIVPPLQDEINKLRNDVQRLNKALESIWGCPHVERCPVKYELLLSPPGAAVRPVGNTDRVGDRPGGGEPEGTGRDAGTGGHRGYRNGDGD